jgi:hypothetical protein
MQLIAFLTSKATNIISLPYPFERKLLKIKKNGINQQNLLTI